MTYIVSSGALNSTHSLIADQRKTFVKVVLHVSIIPFCDKLENTGITRFGKLLSTHIDRRKIVLSPSCSDYCQTPQLSSGSQSHLL